MNLIPRGVYNILDGIWPIILIFVIVVSIVRLSSLYSHGKRIILYQEFISMVFVIYLLLLFELVTNSDMTSIGNNFTPFKEMFRYEIKYKFCKNIFNYNYYFFFYRIYSNKNW